VLLSGDAREMRFFGFLSNIKEKNLTEMKVGLS
jgi:hypothetical protein